jgi:hypothetical protein
MFTSTFWSFYLKSDPRLISIALKTPEWFQGRHYPALAPREDMLHLEEADYRREYQKILDCLDPRQVYEDLGPDAVLLCWEPAGAFCHRRLVAEWLEEHLGVQVPELPRYYHSKQKNLFQLEGQNETQKRKRGRAHHAPGNNSPSPG